MIDFAARLGNHLAAFDNTTDIVLLKWNGKRKFFTCKGMQAPMRESILHTLSRARNLLNDMTSSLARRKVRRIDLSR